MSAEEKISGNITASNNSIEILKNHFPHCFDKHGDFDFEKFKKEVSLASENFSRESYSLDWLGKSYARLLAQDETTTLLKENEEWNNLDENKNSENLLIKGDNLEVLKHLSHAYHEKVKMIYIDPPYNTGSDGFVYEDNRKFTPEKLASLAGIDKEKAKRILSFTKGKHNTHSAWLTFMYPRLYIARRLLKEDGVIFVSIDDNEAAQLRILMDEIFGEQNFVGNIAWESKTKSQNTKDSFNKLQPKVEHILLYTKQNKRRFNLIKKGEKEYLDKDEKGKFRVYPVEIMNSDGIRGRESLIFPIKGIHPPKGKQWKFGQETISKFGKRGDLYTDNGKVFLKMRPIDEDADLCDPFWGLLTKKLGTAESAKKELTKILSSSKHGFETVKPLSLMERLIFHSTSKKDIVMDFFAGSGTTGDAVMRLNAEDGGNRKYILVQLPEVIDQKKNKTAYDFVKNELGIETPTIFEITKERLIRAAKKIKEEQKENKELFSEENEIDLGFKIFETEDIWENYYYDADELDGENPLFNEESMPDNGVKTLLTTWKTYDNTPLTENLKAIDLDGYMGYYSQNKLYLMDKNFQTKNLKKLLEEIDSNRDFSPESIIVFGYHFESKSLREIAENVSSYSNKKSIKIDFVVRY